MRYKLFFLIVAVVMFIYGIITIASSGWIPMIIGAAAAIVILRSLKKVAAKGKAPTNSMGESLDVLTPDGKLPFGWVHYNSNFINEQLGIINTQWDAVLEAKKTENYLKEYSKYFKVVNTVGEFCKLKGECHYKWFCENVIGAVWYNQNVAEYRELKTRK